MFSFQNRSLRKALRKGREGHMEFIQGKYQARMSPRSASDRLDLTGSWNRSTGQWLANSYPLRPFLLLFIS